MLVAAKRTLLFGDGALVPVAGKLSGGQGLFGSRSGRESTVAPDRVKGYLPFVLCNSIIHYMYLVKPRFRTHLYTLLMARKPRQVSVFSRNLRRLRKERGLSQYDLAELTGMSQRMVHHYETSVSEPPLSKLELLAKALKVRPADLLEMADEQDESEDALRFDTRSLKKLRDILELPPNDRSFLYRTLNNLVRKNQLERAAQKTVAETPET